MTGTTAEDYAHGYYNEAHLGGYGEYTWESEEWRGFFTSVADRIVGLIEPTTTLDVGCAKGLLVQALMHAGVDSKGFDISEYAVQTAHEEVRDRLFVGSATAPIEGRYDLITCIEVLEHMSPEDAQKAIDRMCAASDRILFSSSPADFAESTHINTQPTAQWAAWFAERGFYRRADCDTTFLTAWSILFEKDEKLAKRSIVERYETLLAPLKLEAAEKRQALLEAHRDLSNQQQSHVIDRHVYAMAEHDDAILARHSELTAVDHVIGLESRVGVLQDRVLVYKNRISILRKRLERMQGRLLAANKAAAPAPPVSSARRVGRALRRRMQGSGR